METPETVVSATDGSQLMTKERREKQKRQTEMNDLRAVMGTREGRRFLWRTLARSGVNSSVVRMGFDQSAMYLAGKQDIGHFLQAELIEANSGAYLQMQKEAMKDAKDDADHARAEMEAMRTAKENLGEDDDG